MITNSVLKNYQDKLKEPLVNNCYKCIHSCTLKLPVKNI